MDSKKKFDYPWTSSVQHVLFTTILTGNVQTNLKSSTATSSKLAHINFVAFLLGVIQDSLGYSPLQISCSLHNLNNMAMSENFICSSLNSTFLFHYVKIANIYFSLWTFCKYFTLSECGLKNFFIVFNYQDNYLKVTQERVRERRTFYPWFIDTKQNFKPISLLKPPKWGVSPNVASINHAISRFWW